MLVLIFLPYIHEEFRPLYVFLCQSVLQSSDTTSKLPIIFMFVNVEFKRYFLRTCYSLYIYIYIYIYMGTRWCSWLRHCTTSRKVVCSIPDGVFGIFLFRNPSGRPVAFGSTQPLTEMITRNISWGVKAAIACGWQPYHLHVPTVLKSGSLNLLEPSGPVQACNWIAWPWYIYIYIYRYIYILTTHYTVNNVPVFFSQLRTTAAFGKSQ